MDALHNPALPLTWRDGYARLGATFATPWQATPLRDLHWVSVNHRLAQALGLPADWQQRPGMLEVLGNGQPVPGASPVATVYSGHQFGVWAGQLGDGRALLLGESCPPLALSWAPRNGNSKAQAARPTREWAMAEPCCVPVSVNTCAARPCMGWAFPPPAP